MHFVIIKLFAHFHNYMLNKEILNEHLHYYEGLFFITITISRRIIKKHRKLISDDCFPAK